MCRRRYVGAEASMVGAEAPALAKAAARAASAAARSSSARSNFMPAEATSRCAFSLCCSAIFAFLLSKGVLARPFVRFEVGEALKHTKQLLLVHESDPRHQPFDFETDVNEAPAWLRETVKSHESLQWHRRGYLRDATIDQLWELARLASSNEEQQAGRGGSLADAGGDENQVFYFI